MNSSSSNNMYISTSSPYLCGDNNMVPALSPYTNNTRSDGQFSGATLLHQTSSPSINYWSSSIQTAEDTLSACSSSVSSSNTPELENQSLLYHHNTSTVVVDPTIFTTTSGNISTNQVIYQQQQLMMTPLSFDETQQHKVISTAYLHHPTIVNCQQQTHIGIAADVSYAYYPTTTSYYPSPIMSATATKAYEQQQNNNHSTNPNTYEVYHNSRHSNYGSTTPSSYALSHMSSKNNSYNNYNNTLPPQQQPQDFHPHDNQTSSPKRKTSITNKQTIFPCSEPDCTKVFSRPYNLKSHMRTHTHERPFECQYKLCGWKFARVHDLKRHELQHSGLKPHGCEFCHRRFARSDALKRHWKVDAGCARALKQYKLRHDNKEPIGKNSKKAVAS